MFNPYIPDCGPTLEPPKLPPQPQPPPSGPPSERSVLEGLLGRLGSLERDDLILGALVYLLSARGQEDRLWPLLAAALYFLL